MAATSKTRTRATARAKTSRSTTTRAGSARSGASGRSGGSGRPGGATRRPPARARRSRLAAGGGLPTLHLAPHQVDILALALIALGIFLGGVAYAGWAGGALGHGTISVLRLLVGVLADAVPVILVLAGALILLRELRPPVRPLRAGLICLTVALTLALAAGTLGIGPGQAEVEDDEVGQERVGRVERDRPVAGHPDLVALHAQRTLEDLGDRVVVLDDEHPG